MNNLSSSSLVTSEEVATALSENRAVVALETTIIVQGLPAPVNLEVARACEAAVRSSGATPATIGLFNGCVVVGLTIDELEQLADPQRRSAKLSARDLGVALATGADGATTVAGTIAVAHRAGISVMATGGLGGVHRDASSSFDESADLATLARTSVLVVASGVKSILDIGATLERLDTLGVPVAGYQTRQFPGFYLRESGFALDWALASANEAAAAFVAHRQFSPSGFLVANPVPQDHELDRALHDAALENALSVARAKRVTGKDVTPTLLSEFARHTQGVSVQVNRELVVNNARLAGEIATSLASL
ncbi:MAG TPA: pseudouridine-5'-phosphate glycosidase [Acidimicrobiales bacterium]|nr:pseudouridine-5'-phosphate glycosidase [Acidimicrobiales bacterium]